jgi:site-specific recombinase XerD
MEHAIPGFASWQPASVPRFLAAEDVERVIGSYDGHAFALRGRTLLLLLERLGLQASEVTQLKFAEVDLQIGTPTVSGKGRRQDCLLLPREAGDAIMVYLHQRRPALHVPELFTTILAPLHALTRAGATHIVRAARLRAGLKARINGAHVLRYVPSFNYILSLVLFFGFSIYFASCSDQFV